MNKELIEHLAEQSGIAIYLRCLSDKEAAAQRERFATLIAEECAKFCEQRAEQGLGDDDFWILQHAADAIREAFKP